MKKNRTASLRQEAYSSRCLQQGNVIDRLREHWGALYQMEAALRDQDAMPCERRRKHSMPSSFAMH